ncbi:hypothetical protein BLOT_007786 [Blomia tropicalis]|nr:hypothetical protein BLOT_007786 [Blomia tropicalis]
MPSYSDKWTILILGKWLPEEERLFVPSNQRPNGDLRSQIVTLTLNQHILNSIASHVVIKYTSSYILLLI